ncbi:epidermal growth factor receptor substrate 15-like 1 [Sarcoptes scabiei]|nr:epidermal growth factor receptor substrate 15-like 1 [Sarcoptes scabiei]
MDSITLEDIAGEHRLLYEKFHSEINPKNSEIIQALDAANFMRKSGLNQLTLKIIWDLCDPNQLGHLDKKSFFASLKLISMVQNGKQPSYSDLKSSLPPPTINDDFFKSIDWKISKENDQKFVNIFYSMSPVDGKLSGVNVKPFLMSSKLSLESLTRIWDLSDIDQDGFLDLKEFVICNQLIAKATQGFILPPILPKELENYQPIHSRQNEISKRIDWIVSDEEKIKSAALFVELDDDKDGLVSGVDLKDTLLESGLHQTVLAHIWNLCDINETGKLNAEQFALAQYFIKQKQNGEELPDDLLPNMVPPSLRVNADGSSTNSENDEKTSTSSTGNKEFDILNEEIKKLHLEKSKFETEVVADEASLRLKQSEIQNVQNEIETLTQMLKQLENQKNDATKRIDDLSLQLRNFENNLHEIASKLKNESKKVENLNREYNDQKNSISGTESDINAKKNEFEILKDEEKVLEEKFKNAKNDCEQISKIAADTQLEISQIKTNTMELDEYERQFNELVYDYDNAISNADYAKIISLLSYDIPLPPSLSNEDVQLEDFKDEFQSDPFDGEDPFKDDVFGSKAKDQGFATDNFANFDAFTNSSNSKTDDPFGFSPFDSNQLGSNGRSESPTPALPPKKSKAPPPRPAPPKSTNKTPLRAAPPPPSKDAASNHAAAFNETNFDPFNDQNRDPFGSDTFATQNFANFADFNNA